MTFYRKHRILVLALLWSVVLVVALIHGDTLWAVVSSFAVGSHVEARVHGVSDQIEKERREAGG